MKKGTMFKQKTINFSLGLYRISGHFLISGSRPDIRFHMPDIRLEKLFKIKNSFDNSNLSIYNKRSESRFVEN